MLLLTAVVCAGHPVAARGRLAGDSGPAASPHFRLWVGIEDTFISAPPYPGLGLAVGVRVHPCVAIAAEGYLAARLQIQGWYALAGVRLSPLLRDAVRLDVDLRAGPGNHGRWIKGSYWIDGEVVRPYPMLRADASLLGSVDAVLGIGPRLRLETQPLFILRRGHLEDGTEETAPRLAWRSHQALAGAAWEFDLGRGNHLGVEVLAGITAFGDHSSLFPTFHAALGWSWDDRPVKAACRAGEGRDR